MRAKTSKLEHYAQELLDTQRDLLTCMKQFSHILKASCYKDREKIKDTVSRKDYSAAQDLLIHLSHNLEARMSSKISGNKLLATASASAQLDLEHNITGPSIVRVFLQYNLYIS